MDAFFSALKQIRFWAWPLLITVALFLTPVATVLSSFFSGPSASWSHLVDTVLLEYTVNSILLILGVAVGVLCIGVTAAWLTASCEFPLRSSFEWLLLLPLSMPAYIIAYTYTGMLDFSGPLQSLLRHLFSWSYGDYYFPEIRSLGGAIAMMSLVLYPYVYLLARNAFANQSASIHDAAKTLGHNTWQRFLHISLPIARPAIIAGLALALMEALADYGTVQYFGVNVLSTGIFRTWFGLNDAVSARQIAGILLIFVFALLALERYARRKTNYIQSGASKRTARLQLNAKHRMAAIIFCTTVVLVGFVLPFLQLLYWVLFESVLHLDHDFWVLIVNSVKLAAITAFFAVFIAVGLAYMQREIHLRFIHTAVFTASLGYAIPGTVIAVGVMIPFAAADHAMDNFFRTYFNFSSGLLLSGTLFILVFAYLVRFLAVSLGNVQTGLLGIHSHLDDAAKSLGMNAGKTVTRVHLPLLRSSLLSAALLVFVDTLKELPATLVLRPFNFNTLAVRSYELANDEQLANAAPAVITIVLAGLIPVILLNASMRQKSHTAKAQSV